ncbi:MAG: hypothetical protein Q7K26_05095 [bacterium]|nr:hypothetical protein [bacterium]
MKKKFLRWSAFALTLAFVSSLSAEEAAVISLAPKTDRLKNLKASESRVIENDVPGPKGEKSISKKLESELVILSFHRTFVGDAEGALEAFNRTLENNGPANANDLEKINSAAVEDAVAAILHEAKSRQIVILNESHHVPLHRAFAMVLARELRKIGFTYLACEAFSQFEPPPATKTYIADNAGMLTKETTFANFLRESIQQNWKLINYEPISGPREFGMAKNIVDRVFKDDPKARVFIYVGYSHVNEFPKALEDNDNSRMAAQLKRLTGIDPLTIDQTYLYQHKDTTQQIALYDAALKKQTTNKPYVLKASGNSYLKVGLDPQKVDMQVVHPKSGIDPQTGRASWLRSMVGLTPKAIPLELLPKKGRRLIYAYHLNDPLDAAPADVVMVEEGKPIPKFMLPKGEFRFAFEE